MHLHSLRSECGILLQEAYKVCGQFFAFGLALASALEAGRGQRVNILRAF